MPAVEGACHAACINVDAVDGSMPHKRSRRPAATPSRLNPLRTFDGRWVVHEQPPEACAHWSDSGSGTDQNGGQIACSLLTLEQQMQPAVPLPPPLGGVLAKLACKQLRGIFADLQREAARINRGQPTLWSHGTQRA